METIKKIYQYYKQSYNISTDSRKIEPGCVFIALKGEHFDGNDFACQVANEGIASCVIADRKDLPQQERLFIVDDSLSTLQQLAIYHRQQNKIPVIGITGTNGKTTTKELISAILSKKFNIINTQGNFNNHLGVPLTILQIKPDTEMAVVEMGANHPYEITQLCSISQPDFGLITNIGKAHLEGFGNFEGIVKAKNELYDYIKSKNGLVFVNYDNKLLRDLSKDMLRYTYGKDDKTDIKTSIISSNPYLSIRWESENINTNLVGDYNFENVMAAIAVGMYFEVDKNLIIKAIEEYTPANNRSQIIKTSNNNIVMDAYNANPVSMEFSIRNFKNICEKKSMLILGDMKELGKESDNEHRIIIKLIKDLAFKNVILVGDNFKKAAENTDFKTFKNVEDLIAYINDNKIKGYNILIKGSHGIHLEKLVNLL